MMRELVSITIEYIGVISRMTGKNSETIILYDDVSSLAIQVSAFLKNEYGIKQPVLLLVNGQNLISFTKEHKGERLQNGTWIKVMPIMSGG
jgi:hypothetical protein